MRIITTAHRIIILNKEKERLVQDWLQSKRLKGNVQFREVKAEECNCLQCITIRLYVMNLLLDKIQMILTFL